MNSFWLVLWACILALGWLLPNHYHPWLAFHADAWIAVFLSIASLTLFWRCRAPVVWHRITLLAALLVGVPGLQAVLGLIPLTGVAWVSSAYLLGFLLVLLTGAHWEKFKPGQAGDALFLAIGLAAIVSVGLQLQQWLQLDGLELWNMGSGSARPHANLGQPNQLGTLLLWGVLAAAWGWVRGHLKPGVAIFMATYLLIGVALTASRTAWIAVALLVFAAWGWRRLWASPRVPWVVTGLGVYFVVCNMGLAWLRDFLQLGATAPLDVFSVTSSQQRLLAWAVFMDAVQLRPLLGYGWNQTAMAHMAAAAINPAVNGVFSYAHNLFLDLVIWCGIPAGVFIVGCLVRWFWCRARAVQSTENAVLILLLLVVANHAMLELPLYYAYFLLPAGLVMGMLNVRLGARPVFSMHLWVTRLLGLAASALLVLLIRDYSRIEPSYQNLRFEQLRIKVVPVPAPDVLLLTQWKDFIEFARVQPKAGMSDAEIEHMRAVAGLFSGGLFLHKLATALALNHQPEEASLWLQRMCTVAPKQECVNAKAIWAKQALTSPEIAAIPWPVAVVD